MDSASTFTYRHFETQRDFAALVILLQTVEQVDQDGEDVSEAALREQLTWPGHDPALDRWVVLSSAGNALIGYGSIFQTSNDEHADLYIAVHPQWRRQGIGSTLLGHLLERARERRARDVRTYAAVQHQGARAFLRTHDFDAVVMYTRLVVAGTRSFPEAELPPGFVIRRYDQVQQLDLLVEAMNRGYEGLWGHRYLGREEWVEWLPQIRQEGIFLLFAPGEAVAGICRAEMSEHLTMLREVSTGLVDAPGVVIEYREAGLYEPLILTALQSLIPHAPSRIEMESWGDEAATLA